MMFLLDAGSSDVIVASIVALGSLITALLTFHRAGKLVKDTKPNGGDSSRDLLDRLDRRSLVIEERQSRSDEHWGHVEKLVHDAAEVAADAKSIAATTKIHVNVLDKKVNTLIDTVAGIGSSVENVEKIATVVKTNVEGR